MDVFSDLRHDDFHSVVWCTNPHRPVFAAYFKEIVDKILVELAIRQDIDTSQMFDIAKMVRRAGLQISSPGSPLKKPTETGSSLSVILEG